MLCDKPEHNIEKCGLGMKLRMICNAIDKTMNCAAASLDLTSSQSFILGYLIHNRERAIYPRDLEAHFNLKHPTITGILQRLVEKGFIYFSPSSSDRRLKCIILTQKAIAAGDKIRVIIDDMESSLLCGLSEDDRKSFFGYINKITENTLKRCGTACLPIPPLQDIIQEENKQ